MWLYASMKPWPWSPQWERRPEDLPKILCAKHSPLHYRARLQCWPLAGRIVTTIKSSPAVVKDEGQEPLIMFQGSSIGSALGCSSEQCRAQLLPPKQLTIRESQWHTGHTWGLERTGRVRKGTFTGSSGGTSHPPRIKVWSVAQHRGYDLLEGPPSPWVGVAVSLEWEIDFLILDQGPIFSFNTGN